MYYWEWFKNKLAENKVELWLWAANKQKGYALESRLEKEKQQEKLT